MRKEITHSRDIKNKKEASVREASFLINVDSAD